MADNGILNVKQDHKQSYSFSGFPFSSLMGLTGYSWNGCEQVEVCFFTLLGENYDVLGSNFKHTHRRQKKW